jgi:peptidoglycan/LPS O-acetylase OafA/YrhL
MTKDRNVLIDGTKLLLAFSVVFMHLVPNEPQLELISQPLLTFTVPFFFTIALYFFVHKVRKNSELRLAELNLERLLLPYCAWTVIYLALRMFKYRSNLAELQLGSPLEVALYGGAALHLYFLPFLLLCEAWVLSFAFISRAWRPTLIGISIFVGAFAFSHIGNKYAFFYFDHAFSRSLLYVAAAFLLHAVQSWSEYAKLLNTVVSGVLAAFLVFASFGQWPEWVVFMRGPLAGYALASLALSWRVQMKPNKAMKYLLGYSFGIYLSHIAFMAAFEMIADKLGFKLAPYSFLEKLPITLLICVCCIIFIVFVRKNRLARLFLLGETTAPSVAVEATRERSIKSFETPERSSRQFAPAFCGGEWHLLAQPWPLGLDRFNSVGKIAGSDSLGAK